MSWAVCPHSQPYLSFSWNWQLTIPEESCCFEEDSIAKASGVLRGLQESKCIIAQWGVSNRYQYQTLILAEAHSPHCPSHLGNESLWGFHLYFHLRWLFWDDYTKVAPIIVWAPLTLKSLDDSYMKYIGGVTLQCRVVGTTLACCPLQCSEATEGKPLCSRYWNICILYPHDHLYPVSTCGIHMLMLIVDGSISKHPPPSQLIGCGKLSWESKWGELNLSYN